MRYTEAMDRGTLDAFGECKDRNLVVTSAEDWPSQISRQLETIRRGQRHLMGGIVSAPPEKVVNGLDRPCSASLLPALRDGNVSSVHSSSVSGAVLSPEVTNGVEPVAVNTAVFSGF